MYFIAIALKPTVYTSLQMGHKPFLPVEKEDFEREKLRIAQS